MKMDPRAEVHTPCAHTPSFPLYNEYAHLVWTGHQKQQAFKGYILYKGHAQTPLKQPASFARAGPLKPSGPHFTGLSCRDSLCGSACGQVQMLCFASRWTNKSMFDGQSPKNTTRFAIGLAKHFRQFSSKVISPHVHIYKCLS